MPVEIAKVDAWLALVEGLAPLVGGPEAAIGAAAVRLARRGLASHAAAAASEADLFARLEAIDVPTPGDLIDEGRRAADKTPG